MASKCYMIGQPLRVVDGQTGKPVISQTVPRACRGCGVVVTVQTSADGLAIMPFHDSAGPARQTTVQLCDANTRKGTGTGACDRPLDAHGRCDRASAHIG